MGTVCGNCALLYNMPDNETVHVTMSTKIQPSSAVESKVASLEGENEASTKKQTCQRNCIQVQHIM